MATSVSICNIALQRLGVESISSLFDDNNRAKVMNNIYNEVRKQVLKSSRWVFAIKRATIAANAVTPAFGFSYYFDLPTDYIIAIDEYNDETIQREGDYIACDADSIQLRYIYDVEDTTKFSPEFIKILYLSLAVEASYSLIQDKALKSQLDKELEKALSDARFDNAKESTPEEFEIDTFIDVRY